MCGEKFLTDDDSDLICGGCYKIFEKVSDKRIKLISADNPEFRLHNSYVGVYLHGALADDMNYDIFATDVALLDGVNTYKFGEDRIVSYIWESEVSFFSKRGLLVYEDDAPGIEFAKEKYAKKAQNL